MKKTSLVIIALALSISCQKQDRELEKQHGDSQEYKAKVDNSSFRNWLNNIEIKSGDSTWTIHETKLHQSASDGREFDFDITAVEQNEGYIGFAVGGQVHRFYFSHDMKRVFHLANDNSTIGGGIVIQK